MRYILQGILDSVIVVIYYFSEELNVLFNCLLWFLHEVPLKNINIQGCQFLIHSLQIIAVILNTN